VNNTNNQSTKGEQRSIRARKHEDERYDHKIFVYVSSEQYKNLAAAADKKGLSVSCVIRETLAKSGLL
jgi:hypothetical protein